MWLVLLSVSGSVIIIFLIVLSLKKIPTVNKYFFYISIILLFAGVFLVLNEKSTESYYDKIADWPRTKAEIIAKRITGERAVLPEVTYRYSVDGKTYKGKSNLGVPAFGGRNKRTLTAQIALKDEPVGSKLLIAYNPDHPSVSTTQFHPPWNYYGKIGFGAFIYAGALLIILFRLSGKRNKISLPVV